MDTKIGEVSKEGEHVKKPEASKFAFKDRTRRDSKSAVELSSGREPY
jgi:hypothetical protein